MVTIEQEVVIQKVINDFDGLAYDDDYAIYEEKAIRALLDKVDELEREIEQLKEMIKR